MDRYYHKYHREVPADIDLEGLVPSMSKTLAFSVCYMTSLSAAAALAVALTSLSFPFAVGSEGADSSDVECERFPSIQTVE